MSTWVLLRGLTRESAHWGDFFEILRAELPGATVIGIDLPGSGRLFEARSPTRIESVTQSCREQLLRLGVSPPYHLLAMSMGAMVAVDWASRHPQELCACVLINTSLRPWSPWYQRLRPAAYPSLLSALLVGGLRRREQTILRWTSRHAHAPSSVIGQWMAIQRARPVSRANALRQLLSAARFHAPVLAPEVPLLVLASRRDALVDPRCSRRVAELWHAGFVEHPTAGHDLPLDDGPWVARQISRWMSSVGQGARPCHRVNA